jgi:hypothetical protein
MRRIIWLLAAPLLTATPLSVAFAQDQVPVALTDSTATLNAADADMLKPGDYLWHPELALAGAVGIVVDLEHQVAFVYRGDTLIGITTVSTGKDGHETPLGTFPILQKQVEHKSNLYDAAPMPYMQRLTWDGVALHAGGVPGYRESHGCVHLPPAFAKALYALTDVGATVAITDGGTTLADALPMIPVVPVEAAPAMTTDRAPDAAPAAASVNTAATAASDLP